MLLHNSADLLPDVDEWRCMTDVDEIREIMMEERDLEPQIVQICRPKVRIKKIM